MVALRRRASIAVWVLILPAVFGLGLVTLDMILKGARQIVAMLP